MNGWKHQVAVQLDSAAFERLKRLSSASGKPYAATIAQALEALEGYTSEGLAGVSGFRTYAQLPDVERRAWRVKVRQWRTEGCSFGGIAKRLFKDHGITGADGLPLGASTVRGMAASGPAGVA
ncbi:MAG: hypothetical protein P9F75_09230 [Candidatus Contendobacter sp.]|nr:hypothetical protein [Candidatus Contendobacter sp.]